MGTGRQGRARRGGAKHGSGRDGSALLHTSIPPDASTAKTSKRAARQLVAKYGHSRGCRTRQPCCAEEPCRQRQGVSLLARTHLYFHLLCAVPKYNMVIKFRGGWLEIFRSNEAKGPGHVPGFLNNPTADSERRICEAIAACAAPGRSESAAAATARAGSPAKNA